MSSYRSLGEYIEKAIAEWEAQSEMRKPASAADVAYLEPAVKQFMTQRYPQSERPQVPQMLAAEALALVRRGAAVMLASWPGGIASEPLPRRGAVRFLKQAAKGYLKLTCSVQGYTGQPGDQCVVYLYVGSQEPP